MYERKEWEAIREKDEHLKILVIRDSRSKGLFAHAVVHKGVDSDRYVVDKVVEECQWLGYTRLMLKSDNEPAIALLIQETLKALRVTGEIEQVNEERAVPYDPMTNGSAEAGVKLVKGSLRTLRSDLESRLGKRIPVTHPVMTWLVTHAADVRTFRVKGADGQTAFQKIRGDLLSPGY